MGWLGRKRKPREEEVEEAPYEPLKPLRPVLNLLVPDIAGATSFHLRQFYSTEEAQAYVEALESVPGLHAFWGLHEPPDGHVSGEGMGEAMVLIRSAEGSDTVYVVSFVDLESANAFARFEAKRGMSLGLLLIYWAELVHIDTAESGVRLTPEAPPPPPRRVAAERFPSVAAAPGFVAGTAPGAVPPADAEPAVAPPQPQPTAEVEIKASTQEPQPVAHAESEAAMPEPKPVVEAEPDVVVSQPAPVGHDAVMPQPDPLVAAGPEPEAQIRQAEPVAAAEQEIAVPEADIEAESGTPEPRRVFEVQLTRPAPEPVLAVEEDVRPEEEPAAVEEPTVPEPAKGVEQEVRPEPEPVAPEEAATPGPQPVVEPGLRPEPEPVALEQAATPEPVPVVERDATPEPEPVALEETEPVLQTPPPLFAADSGAGAPTQEEIDIEREAIAFLRASAGAERAAPESKRVEPLATEPAAPAEPAEIVRKEPAPVGNWMSGGTVAPEADDFAQVAAPVRGWESAAAGQEPETEEEYSEERVHEVAKILKVKRWDKKDSPFRGFDSPPGRF